MTKPEAIEYAVSHNDHDQMDDDDLLAAYSALYDGAPSDEDWPDVWSHIHAHPEVGAAVKAAKIETRPIYRVEDQDAQNDTELDARNLADAVAETKEWMTECRSHLDNISECECPYTIRGIVYADLDTEGRWVRPVDGVEYRPDDEGVLRSADGGTIMSYFTDRPLEVGEEDLESTTAAIEYMNNFTWEVSESEDDEMSMSL